VILNDPGRLISVHIMHTALVAGWSGVMLLYELIIYDPTDPVYNPSWRQGCYVLPFVTRLGVIDSIQGWSFSYSCLYGCTYETVCLAHILLSGLVVLGSFWHWAYWDLDCFVESGSSKLVLDLNRIFGIHLLLAAVLMLGFGFAHLTGYFGPGMWTSDSFGIVGGVRFVKPVYSINRLVTFCYGVISSHHIVGGFVGINLAFWHISSRPGPTIYKLLNLGNIELVLSTSIPAVFLAAFVNSALMWYGSSTTQHSIFGPSRYHWDNAYFTRDIENRVNGSSSNQSSIVNPVRVACLDKGQ
jgi:photosystem II CP47 chlorophyll apoprotein